MCFKSQILDFDRPEVLESGSARRICRWNERRVYVSCVLASSPLSGGYRRHHELEQHQISVLAIVRTLALSLSGVLQHALVLLHDLCVLIEIFAHVHRCGR
jgi:hypothetical protein